jgi:16S rRNA processing protein RimM
VEDLSDPVVIGVVVAPHGVRGTLRVRALGPGRHLREGTEPVVAGMRRRISAARQTPKGFLLDLEGVESRADAKPLGGEQLLLDREELDAPEEGEFYVADLVGLAAVNGISISLLLWNTCLRWILRRDKSWSDHRKARR